jgi:mono/diheme cytochrome c family protein
MLLPALLAVVAPSLFQDSATSEAKPVDVADLFQTRCVACHVAPDPTFAVERAWIAQVADTA